MLMKGEEVVWEKSKQVNDLCNMHGDTVSMIPK